MTRPASWALLAVIAAVLSACAAAPETWLASGRIGAVAVRTTVDSQAAALLLAADDDAQAEPGDTPSSPDVEALRLARRIERTAATDPLVARYRTHMARGDAPRVSLAGQTYVLMPGWLYRADPTTGADLEPQARLLRASGARVIRAETAENGSVESNAAVLAQTLRGLSAESAAVTLVSASKGGAEAALALTLLAQRGEASHVRGWVNIGGTLRGTALADLALSWPACWFVEAAVLPDRSFTALRSIATSASVQRAGELRLPTHVRVVNLIGIALSGQISPRARTGYRLLRGRGANDGITVLADALAPNASTIALIGADHFFDLPDIDAHTLAVAAALASTTLQ